VYSKKDKKRVEQNRMAALAAGKVLPPAQNESRAVRTGRISSPSPKKQSRPTHPRANASKDDKIESLAQNLKTMCTMLATMSAVPQEFKDLVGAVSEGAASLSGSSNVPKSSGSPSKQPSPLKVAQKEYLKIRGQYKSTQGQIESKKSKLLRLQNDLSVTLQDVNDLEALRLLQAADLANAEHKVAQLMQHEQESGQATEAGGAQGASSPTVDGAKAAGGVASFNIDTPRNDGSSSVWNLLSGTKYGPAKPVTTQQADKEVFQSSVWSAASDEAAQMASEGMSDVEQVNAKTRTSNQARDDDKEVDDTSEAPAKKKTTTTTAPTAASSSTSSSLPTAGLPKEFGTRPEVTPKAKSKPTPLGDFKVMAAGIAKAMECGGAPLGPSPFLSGSAPGSSAVSSSSQAPSTQATPREGS